MPSHFECGKDSQTERRATRAYVEQLLEEMLPAMRLAARGDGYALAVHGSLSRDIDIVAIPWVDSAREPDALADTLCGVIAGYLGRATKSNWTDMPHGRRATMIYHAGGMTYFDLSVMPKAEQKKEATP